MSQVAAQRYAQALFELARDREVSDEVAEGLIELHRRLTADVAARRLYLDQGAAPDAKKRLVDEKLAKGLHPFIGNVMKLLVDRGREDILGRMILEFFELKEAADGIIHVAVESAFPLEGEARDELLKRLSEATGKKVEADIVVKPDLLGGLRITVGSTRIDGTIRRQYEELEQKLKSVV
ncbi:MAG TPA: ATP synthase F1 subunit delta [Planctomycetes bacterium]|nr:ATP synthase F1 subunit delta [Planctomycetota bacterium]